MRGKNKHREAIQTYNKMALEWIVMYDSMEEQDELAERIKLELAQFVHIENEFVWMKNDSKREGVMKEVRKRAENDDHLKDLIENHTIESVREKLEDCVERNKRSTPGD